MVMPRPQDATDRWVGVDSSADADLRRAGAQAATGALAGRPAELVLVFCTSGLDAEQVLAGVCSVVDDRTPVVGGTTMGEVSPADDTVAALVDRPGVTVLALGGPGFQVTTMVARDASAHRRESGIAAAAAMAPIDRPHRALLMIADGLTEKQHELVRGAYAAVGATVPIVGGCSGDVGDQRLTRQFHGTGAGVEILEDTLVGIGLGSTAPIGIGIAHGWHASGPAMLVTSSEGGTIFELDGQPALQGYLDLLAGHGLDPDEVRRLATDDKRALRDLLFTRPLGLSRRSGQDLRVVHDLDVERGTVICLADVPQGATAWLMVTDVDSLIGAAADSCRSAADALGGADPIGYLVFDCGGRRATLGPENVLAEQRAIADLAGNRPVGGFYTHGEFGRMHGARGMHHLTVVTLALA